MRRRCPGKPGERNGTCWRLNAVGIWLLLAVAMSGCRSAALLERESIVPPPAGKVALFRDSAGGGTVICGEHALAGRRFPPCSTFKIVSTLMGLDAGVVTGSGTRLGYDGTRYEVAAWNGDLTLEEAFRASCVPYYRKLTGKLEREYVGDTLRRLDYGNCDIGVWNSNGHNVFWIDSSLLISPGEQVDVLEKIFSGASGFRPEHVAILKSCMENGRIGEWTLYGKTGSGRNHNTDRLEGWFVGFAEDPAGHRIFFAAHGADSDRNLDGPAMREWIRELLERRFDG